MAKAKLTNTVMVVCPYCNGENEIDFCNFGDNEFTCQYTHCDKPFEIPEFFDYAHKVQSEVDKFL